MLKAKLEQTRGLLWKRAQEVFEQKRKTHLSMGPFINRFLEELEDSLKGGKAVRGSLVCHGAIACGGKVTPAIIDLALAFELFHTYLLIHDDLIDRDDMRRGKPSFHKRYQHMDNDGYLPSDPEHFGRSMAIMAGDILCSMGYDLICKTDLPAEIKLKIVDHVTQTLFETGAGEILDVLNDLADNPSKEHLMKVHTLKTSRYTFYSPLTVGAFAVGASREQLEVLQNYSFPIGIAFQLHDDLLGMFGEAEKLGKPVYSDLREGKQTLLIIEAYKRASAREKLILDSALGNPELTDGQAKAVREIVKGTGAFKYSIDLANKFKERALEELTDEHLTEEGYTFLYSIADYIVNREY